jgi:hypothetical protein
VLPICRHPADISADLLLELDLLSFTSNHFPAYSVGESIAHQATVKKRIKQTAVMNCDEYAYPRLLLQEKRWELQALELKHKNKLMSTKEYLSCHRSILQGISELENLLLTDPKALRMFL